jgi:hypothetical protein
MNLIKIKDLVINLDNVAYWRAYSTAEYNKSNKDALSPDPNSPIRPQEDADDPIVVIHFIGGPEKGRLLRLGMPMSRAFLAHLKASGLLNEVQPESVAGSDGKA